MTARFVLHIRELSDMNVDIETRNTLIVPSLLDPTDDIVFSHPDHTVTTL